MASTLQELMAALQANAQAPTPQQEQSNLPNIASGLGLGLNLIGAATGKGNIGSGLTQFARQAQTLQTSRANQQSRAAQQQRGEQGRTLRALLPSIEREDRRQKSVQRAQDIVTQLDDPKIQQNFGLDDVDKQMLKSIAESDPGKVPELFSGFISGKSKLREFKAREKFKKSQKRFGEKGKSEIVLQRMNEGATFEQGLIDAGFNAKERATFIDDVEAAQRSFPGLTPKTLVESFAGFGKQQTLVQDIPLGGMLPDPIGAQPATTNVPAPGIPQPGTAQNTQPASIEQQALEMAFQSNIPPTGENIQRIAGTLREGRRRELVPEAQRIIQNAGQEVTPELMEKMIQFLIRNSGGPQ